MTQEKLSGIGVFRNFVDQVPKYSIIIILYGYFDVYTSYKFFGIRIYNYQEISEFIFTFSSLLIPLALFALSGYAMFLGYYRKIKKVEQMEKEEFAKLYANERKKGPYLIGSCLLILILIAIVRFRNSPENMGDGILLFYFLVFAMATDLLLQWNIDKSFALRPYVFVLTFFLLSVAFILSKNYLRYWKVKNGFPEYTVTIEFDNYKIQSSDKLRYIGSTKGFAFFFESDSTSIVYPLNNVKSIKFNELKW